MRFEVNVTKHYNLNCKGCAPFAPLADASECMDFDVYLRDMQQISKLFGDKANEIHILGGEPMLHLELKRFLQAARELFPSAKICLDTNGTILPKVDEDFWMLCREQRIVIEPTIFTEKQTRRHHTLWKCSLDLTGGQNPKESFVHCGSANRCIRLENGRLYSRPSPPICIGSIVFTKRTMSYLESRMELTFTNRSRRTRFLFLARSLCWFAVSVIPRVGTWIILGKLAEEA